MNKYIILLIVLNIICRTHVVAQQQYPNLFDVKIHANTYYNNIEQMYHYVYKLMNESVNKGSVGGVEIDIFRNSNTLEIDTVGLQFENDGFTEENFRLDFPHLTGRIVPVGFLRTPNICWLGGLTNNCTASFSADSAYINPGGTIEGFELISKGLPGIRRCIVSPYFDVISLFPDPEDTSITYYVPPVDSVRNAVKFYGYTIGPTAPPKLFISTAWCDTILSYTTQSRTLGWIKDEKTEKRLDDKLETAKQLLKLAEEWPPHKGQPRCLEEAERIFKNNQQELSKEYGQDVVRELPQESVEENRLKEFTKATEGTNKADERKHKEYRESLIWAAQRVLQSFVNEVEILNRLSKQSMPERKQYITSEAYALLKYNAEYLIKQLNNK